MKASQVDMLRTATLPSDDYYDFRSFIGFSWNGILWCFFLAFMTGCQSGIYRAANLPMEFRTPSIANQAKINLSRFASTGTSDSLIAVGDLLEVTIVTGRDGEKREPVLARVSDDGKVQLAAIGSVQVVGLEPFEASQNVIAASTEREILRNPQVTISIKSKAVTHITVLGEVNDPGVHEIPRSSCDLIRALGAAGGLTEDASTSVEIIRHSTSFLASDDRGQKSGLQAENKAKAGASQSVGTNKDDGLKLVAYQNLDDNSSPNSTTEQSHTSSQRIDMAAISPRTQANYHLGNRDVVMVHRREKRLIHVSGLVKNPGQFEIPFDQDVHLLGAIAMAGGLNSAVADKVFVIRRIDGKPKPLVIQASLNKSKHQGLENLRLAPGDTINVEHTPSTMVLDAFARVFRISMGLSSTALTF